MPDDIMPTNSSCQPMEDETEKDCVPVTMAAPPAPGAPIEIAFSFDTTGSMSGCINEVKTKVQEIIRRLFSDIPALRIAVLAHGDYCDRESSYVTKFVDFSTNEKDLCDFVKSVGSTGGGDYEECYELALRQLRQELSWMPGTQRSVVMIGDAIPHEKNYHLNKDKIDWKTETDLLYREKGIHIYAVDCGHDKKSDKFFSHLAKATHGKLLKLNNFTTIIDLIMAVCYREHGPEYFEAYEREVRAREGRGMRPELDHMLVNLRDRDPDTSAPASGPIRTARKTKSRKTPYSRKGAAKIAKATPVMSSSPSGVSRVGVTARKTRGSRKTAAAPRKTAKTDSLRGVSKASKMLKKTTTRKPTRIPREGVPSSAFPLSDLSWSKWSLAITAEPPADEEGQWIPRGKGEKGYRKYTLFFKDTRCPAIYELAVQPVDNAKKYVVFQRITKGFTERSHWDTYLLRHEHVRNQISDVISKGCSVYVRRATFDSKFCVGRTSIKDIEGLRKYVTSAYDYAWNKGLYGRQRHRRIVKRGHTISNSEF